MIPWGKCLSIYPVGGASKSRLIWKMFNLVSKKNKSSREMVIDLSGRKTFVLKKMRDELTF